MRIQTEYFGEIEKFYLLLSPSFHLNIFLSIHFRQGTSSNSTFFENDFFQWKNLLCSFEISTWVMSFVRCKVGKKSFDGDKLQFLLFLEGIRNSFGNLKEELFRVTGRPCISQYRHYDSLATFHVARWLISNTLASTTLHTTRHKLSL